MKKLRRQTDKPVTVPARFSPRFWAEADQRCAIVKEIQRRYAELREDTGTESVQKDILCQRATFIAIQLETMECEAMEHGRLDVGVYTQGVNALLGLLKALGLEKKLKKTLDLAAYTRQREQCTS
jgi:hypothetical protein